MSDDAIHFFLIRDCLNHVPDSSQVPKIGSLLLASHLPLQEGEVVLDLGAGAGLIGNVAARRGIGWWPRTGWPPAASAPGPTRSSTGSPTAYWIGLSTKPRYISSPKAAWCSPCSALWACRRRCKSCRPQVSTPASWPARSNRSPHRPEAPGAHSICGCRRHPSGRAAICPRLVLCDQKG